MMNVVQFIVESIGVEYPDFIAKFENDPITQVIMDNKTIFASDIIYGRLLGWFYINFKPIVDAYPTLILHLKDKAYLPQMLTLFIPTVHRKFFESPIYETTPTKIMTVAMQELSIDAAAIKAAAKKEVQLVW